ncbi:MAG: stalk domain-containing protein [Bacillota bacterium]
MRVITFFAAALLVLVAAAGVAQAAPAVVLDGKQLSFDVPPEILQGRVLVPMRALFEAVDAEVQWDGDTGTVTARKGDIEIVLVVGGQVSKNGAPVDLDVPAVIKNGRTMVPLRFVGEALDCRVDWVQSSRTVYVESAGVPVSTGPPAVPAGKLSVVKKGWTLGPRDLNYYHVTYGIEITNLDTVSAADYIDVVVRFSNAEGNIIKTITDQISYIPPEKTVYAGDKVFLSVPPSSMSVEVSETAWDEMGRQIPLFKFYDLQYTSDGSSLYDGEVTGIINNPYNQTLKNVMVTYALYDANEEIIGGGYTFVNLLPGGGTSSFSNYIRGGLTVSKIKAYAVVPLPVDPHLSVNS